METSQTLQQVSRRMANAASGKNLTICMQILADVLCDEKITSDDIVKADQELKEDLAKEDRANRKQRKFYDGSREWHSNKNSAFKSTLGPLEIELAAGDKDRSEIVACNLQLEDEIPLLENKKRNAYSWYTRERGCPKCRKIA